MQSLPLASAPGQKKLFSPANSLSYQFCGQPHWTGYYRRSEYRIKGARSKQFCECSMVFRWSFSWKSSNAQMDTDDGPRSSCIWIYKCWPFPMTGPFQSTWIAVLSSWILVVFSRAQFGLHYRRHTFWIQRLLIQDILGIFFTVHSIRSSHNAFNTRRSSPFARRTVDRVLKDHDEFLGILVAIFFL